MTVLEFDEARHLYKLDGKRAPGVTTITGGGIPKPGIPEWYARGVAEFVADNPGLVESWRQEPDVETTKGTEPAVVNKLKKIPRARLMEAAERGTEIHAAGEALATTGEVDTSRFAAEIQHYADWLDEWEIKPIMVEAKVFKRDPRFCGTLDLIATSRFINNGKPVLFDLKSSNQVYGETSIQTAAYAMADKYVRQDGSDRPMPYIDYTAVVHITPHGVYCHPLNTSRAELEEAYGWFLHAYATYSATNARKKRLRPALVRPPLDMYDTLKGDAHAS